jgi:hypothetical protein
MGEFHVPKVRVALELLLTGKLRRQVGVFVMPSEYGGTARQQLIDLLAAGEAFFPAVDATGRMSFVARAEVLIAWATRDAFPPDEPYTDPIRATISVTMTDGTAITGRIAYVAPRERSRLADFLNDAPSFFELEEGERVALVNKRRIVQVIATEEG